MSIGNENIHQKGEIPEITKLPNGRLRVVRRFHKFTREDVDDANLGSLMGDFGDLDNENEPIADQGYDNCRLISVQVDNRFNSVTNAENPVLVKTYETLTNAFVQIDDDTESTTESGLKTVTKVFRAKSSTTNTDVVGTTTSGSLTLASSKLVDNDAFAELTQVFSESGILNIDTDKKYGGVITVTSITAFNLTQSEAATQSGVSGTFLDSQTKNSGGFETNVFRFVEGSGEIDRSTSEQGILKKTTITSINEHPEYAFGVLVDQKTDTRDFGIVYTHTYAEGSGTIRDVVSTSLGGKLTTTSITSLGVEPTIPIGAAIIESSSSIENGLTLFKVTHVQGQGQVSTSTNPNYGGKLNVVTITSLNEEPTSSGDLVDTDVKAGNGYILYTYSFASGSGEISRQSNPEYNGALTRTTIASINTEPSASGALVDSKVSTQDGFTLYEYTFVEGQGVISTSTNSEYNAALSKTTISSINQEPDGSGVLTDSKVDARDGFTLYTYTYVSGSGEVSRTSNPEYNGKLTRETITTINQEPNGNGALVDAKTSQGDGYILYTYQYVTGSGVIAESTSQQYNGALTLKTISAIDLEPNSEGALIKNDVKTQDGYILYTYTFASGQGEVSRQDNPEYNGTLTKTTITSINEEPSGTGALVDSKTTAGDGYILYTYTYCTGKGEVGRTTSTQYNGKLTLTTVVTIDQEPDADGALIRSDIKSQDGYLLYNYTFASGQGEVSRQSNPEFNGTITRTTVTSINEEPNGTGALVDSEVKEGDGYLLYTYTFVEGSGEVGRSTSKQYNGKLTLTTITSIDKEPNGNGALVASDVKSQDGYLLYIYTYAEGQGEIGRSTNNEYNGTLTKTTITAINEEPDGNGALVDTKTSLGSGYILYTYTFCEGKGEIARTTSDQYNGKLTLTTIVTIDEEPNDSGALVKADVKEGNGYLLYTYTFASGQGEISRQDNPEYNGKLTRTTITSINEEPNGTGALVDTKTTAGDGYILYTNSYVTGEGEISRTESEQYNGKLTLTTITSIGEKPSSSGALVRADVKAGDGYILYTYTFASGQGEISKQDNPEYDGKLTRTTITSINQEPNGIGSLVDTKTTAGDGYILYTSTYIDGAGGEIGRDVTQRYNDKLTLTTVTSIIQEPNESGALVKSDVKTQDGYTIYTYTYAEGQGEISRQSNPEYDGKLNRVTITSINEEPDGTGALVDSNVVTGDGYILYTSTYIDGAGGEIGRSSTQQYNGRLTLTTVTSVIQEPNESGALVKADVKTQDGYALYIYTYAEGQGEISRQENPEYNGKITRTTITSINEEPNGSGALVDSKVVAGDGYILYTSVYVEGEGEISRQENPEYDGKLTRTTVTSINEEPNADGALVDSKTSAGDGYILYTSTYVRGSGEIARKSADSYNGKLTIETVSSINEEPNGTGALVDSKVEAKDGFVIYTYTFASGSGEISRQDNQEYNGRLTKTTITSINEEPNNSGALVDSKTTAGDGYILYTYTYAAGSGEISRQSNPEYNGQLTKTTITSINEEPNGSGALVDSKTSAGDGYILYTHTFAEGQGEISRQSNPEHGGTITRTTITSINTEPSGDGALVDSKVQNGDGFILYTSTYLTGEGEISRDTSTEHQGKLTRTTITSINKVPDADGALIDAKSSSGDGYVLYTYQFLKGEGEISRQSNPEYNGKLTITTISSINTPPDGGSQALVDSRTEANNGYVIYTNRYADGSGEIARSTSSAGRFNRTTISSINEMPKVPAGGTLVDSKVEAKDGFFIGTITSAEPKEGVLSRQTGVGPIPTSTLTTVVQLGTAPTGDGEVYSSKVEIVDGIELFTYQFLNVSGGAIANYQDPIEVEVAGEVSCGTESVDAGGESGTIAVVHAKPISRKTVIADVEINITNNPSASGSPAYSLEGIGCSVVSTNASLRVGGGTTVTTGTSTNKMSRTGYQKSFQASARSNTYTGCVLQSASSNGSISYTAEERPKIENGNISTDTENSSTQSSCRGTSNGGSQITSGLVRSRARPLLTTPNGTTWFEQITWRV